MAVSRALRRLLRIRDLQEEQSRLVLESALGELHRLENAMTATFVRDRQGRSLVQASARTANCRTGSPVSMRRARPVAMPPRSGPESTPWEKKSQDCARNFSRRGWSAARLKP